MLRSYGACIGPAVLGLCWTHEPKLGNLADFIFPEQKLTESHK